MYGSRIDHLMRAGVGDSLATVDEKGWAAEAGKTLLSGTGTGTVFGVGAAAYSYYADGTATCPGISHGYRIVVKGGDSPPSGCTTKTVDLLFLNASSIQAAAAGWGLTIALIVFVVMGFRLARQSSG